MTSKEYLALKNFIHNTCGMSREAIKDIVADAVREMAADAVRRLMDSKAGQSLLSEAVIHYLKWHGTPVRDAIMSLLEVHVRDTDEDFEKRCLDALRKAKLAAGRTRTYIDLSNALFGIEEGVLLRCFPSRGDRERFTKSPEYGQIRDLLNARWGDYPVR